MLTKLVALTVSSFALATSIANAFSYDGTTSDLAQQYYQRLGSSLSPLPITDSSLPDTIIDRLATMSFADLTPQLQRALLWDSGYVVERGTTNLVQIYVPCKQGMADIAVSASDYISAGCKYDATCYAKSTAMKRNGQCNGAQVATASRCAVKSSSVTTAFSSSMWATGGTSKSLPQPNVNRHEWSEGTSKYLMFAIHTLDADEVKYGTCPSSDAANGMIIPCVPLPSGASGTWCTPEPSDFVTSWLTSEAPGGTKSKTSAPSSTSTPAATSKPTTSAGSTTGPATTSSSRPVPTTSAPTTSGNLTNATISGQATAPRSTVDGSSSTSGNTAPHPTRKASGKASSDNARTTSTDSTADSSGFNLLYLIPIVVGMIMLALVGLAFAWRYTKNGNKRPDHDVYHSLD